MSESLILSITLAVVTVGGLLLSYCVRLTFDKWEQEFHFDNLYTMEDEDD